MRAVDRGETVAILYRGKKRKLIIDMASDGAGSGVKTKDQPLFGMWNDRDDLTDPAFYVRHLRQPRPAIAQSGNKKRLAARKPK